MALRLNVFSHETCNVSLKLDGGSVVTKRALTSTSPIHPMQEEEEVIRKLDSETLREGLREALLEGVVTTKLLGTRRCRNRMRSDL